MNFYPCRNLIIGNIKWKTSEHYFQASKFAGTPYFNYVSTLPSPRDAFNFSRERNVQKWIHPNWQSIKLTVMRRVLVEKFSQDETLLKILLKTGNAQLVEHTKNDRFWGDGGDESGENHLGRLLVLVRDQIREVFPQITPQYNPQQTSVHTPYLDQSSNINNSTSSSPFNVYNVPLNPECLPMQLSASSWELDSTIAKTNAISESHQSPNADPSELKHKLPDGYVCPFDNPSSPMSGNETMEVDYNESPSVKGKHLLNLAQNKAEKDDIPETKNDTSPRQTLTSSSPSSSKQINLNTRADSQDKSKGDIPPNPQSHSQTFPLPTSSISSDIKINVFKFSNKLSAYLSQHTDVGLIPRRSGQQSHTSDQFPPRNPCSNVDIVGCYWCGNSNARFEETACCVRCWLLLHEWCVRRVEQVCRLKLCGLPGCEEPRVDPCECCSIEHAKKRSLLIGGVSIRLQEEIELTLGPKWYRDLTPIYFSDSGPFSELSNSFPSLLNLYRMIWPTVQHCMCAQKLLGTPYLHHVRKMERLHELEEWEIRCVKWVRPDWEEVRKRVLYQALMAKFQQNCVLKGLLLRTGSRPLVCRDNAHLGYVLMSVREMLKAATFFPSMNSSFSECENISSANSSTKVLNEPFSVLQSNESKTDTTLDQTPTPSYLGSSKPEDVNAGTSSQDRSMTDTPPVNNTSQTNQPDPANSTVQNSLNPQLNPISSQLTNVLVNQSDKFEQVIVPLADQASDTPEVVQVASGNSNEISHDSATFSPPGSTDDMQ